MQTTLFSATELSKIFEMPAATARARLTTAKVGGNRGGSKLYLLKDAAPFLVPPSDDLEALIKSLRPIDLPPKLAESFWSAMLKRQKFEEEAKDLWRTESVEKLFGETFMLIRETVALWSETIERQMGVTDEQRVQLVEMSDALMTELHKALIGVDKRTVSNKEHADIEMEGEDEVS